jgi:uncharacterized cupin superfamily protein
MSEVTVIREGARAWRALVDPPGARGTGGAEADVFSTPDGAFTTGFWQREPDTWSFVRPYDEIALILAGAAEIEMEDGTRHRIGAGDVLITPRGSSGTWHITETLVKFYAIFSAPGDGEA